MIIYHGKRLEKYVSAICKDYKERFLLEELHSYMISKKSTKVCCLFGLRRTGKTVMMSQEIKRLDDFKNCLYVMCEDGDRLWDVRKEIDRVLEKNPNCNNIFIDEITKADRFINTSSYFSDIYAASGVKIVMSGTDSLGFFIASGNELFDRITFIHTTYIPFREYNHVLGKGLNEYIEYGGTLTDGVDNVFYNNDRANFYTNSAIVENIVSTLKRWDNGRNYANDILRELAVHGDLASFISKVIEYHNRRFVAEIINKDFKSHDLHSLADLMYKHPERFDDPAPLESEDVNDRVRIALGIKENHFNPADENSVDAIINYLKRLDVLYEIPKIKSLDTTKDSEYIFTQVGMRYCQATALAETLVGSGVLGVYNSVQQAEIIQKLKSDIKGGILEDIVFYQLSKNFSSVNENDNSYAVTKFRNAENKEIDVLILDYNNNAVLELEVKLSAEKTSGQRKHLLDNAVDDEIESKTGMRIANKAVVYMGRNGETDDGVLYINAEFLLKYSKSLVNNLLIRPNLTSFSEIFEELGTTEYKGVSLRTLGNNPAKFVTQNAEFAEQLRICLEKSGIKYSEKIRLNIYSFFVKSADKPRFEEIKRELIRRLNGKSNTRNPISQVHKPKRKR